jgi:hypothetical protein
LHNFTGRADLDVSIAAGIGSGGLPIETTALGGRSLRYGSASES